MVAIDPKAGSIVVRPIDTNTERVTESGLIVPVVRESEATIGEILVAGEGCVDARTVVGSIVLFSPFSGYKIVLHGAPYRLLTEFDILAYMKEVTDVQVA